MRTIEVSVQLQTEPAVLWKAITEHQALPRHVSMLREVRVLDSKDGGVGTVRQCTLTSGKSFREEITIWEEGHRYCYRPNTSEAPFPSDWAEACWRIERSGGGSRLSYSLQYRPRSRLRGFITHLFLRSVGVRQIKRMLRSYDQSS